MTTTMIIIGVFLLMFVAFLNGMGFYEILISENENPFFKEWITTINKEQDFKIGKVLMASFFIIISVIALFSYMGFLFKSHVVKSL